MSINWIYKSFEALSNIELYRILAIRQEVFIVEQNCPYPDADGKDISSMHLYGLGENESLLAYARIVPPGISYADPSIGRIVTSPSIRGKGVGKLLMNESIKRVIQMHGNLDIRISAQCYLIPFYQSFGFKEVGDEYLEDDIPHIEMLKSYSSI